MAGRDNIDVIIALDSSGSMKKTDPDTLRIAAAKLFTTLLGSKDRVGIISFSGSGTTLLELSSIDSSAKKDKTFEAIDRVNSNGRYTNIYEALLKGQSLIVNGSKDSNKARFIILMSDGKMDVGKEEESLKLAKKIREELIPSLVEKNIKVYTIAFTKESDKELLSEISKQTSGMFNFVRNDKDIHEAFSTIFESLKSPDMLPIQDGKNIRVDSSVHELTIIAAKDDPETDIELLTPSGTKLSSSGENIRWFSSQKFDMMTITRPEVGTWEILYSTGTFNKAYIITNLSLKSNIRKEDIIEGERKDVDFWFERNGTLLTESEVLDTLIVSLELIGPNNTVQEAELSRKVDSNASLVRGIYNVSFTASKVGRYELTFNVSCETFERAKTYIFDVHRKEAGPPKGVSTQLIEVAVEEKIDWIQIITRFVAINMVLAIIALLYVIIQRRRARADV